MTDEGEALLRAAWGDENAAAPLADWLHDRLPGPGENPVHLLALISPPGKWLYLRVRPDPTDTRVRLILTVYTVDSGIMGGIVCNRNSFATPAAEHIRQRVAEIRRAAAMTPYYDERDDEPDDPDATPIETITAPCLCGCGVPVRQPIDAEGDDCCATPACVRQALDRMQADADEADRAAREWAANNVGPPADDVPY